ncbi:hypothetical protein ACS0TY_008082 [Phlomoides rotata]
MPLDFTRISSLPHLQFPNVMKCRHSQYVIHMDDEVELDVLLVTLFGLIAIMFSEINTCVALLSYGYMNLRAQSRHRRSTSSTYSIRNKVPGQIEKLHFLVGHHDETCKDHIRMNTDCFNRLCYLLRNLCGLRDTRHVSISVQVAIFLTVLSHHTKIESSNIVLSDQVTQ